MTGKGKSQVNGIAVRAKLLHHAWTEVHDAGTLDMKQEKKTTH